MALSGVFFGTTNNPFIKPKIEWSAVQSQEGNYSDVTATLYYSRTNAGWTTSGTWSGSISIGGNKKTETRTLFISYDSNTVAISHTARIDHDSYGNAVIEISATGGMLDADVTLKSTAIGQTVTLDTIARESTIGASDGYIGSAVTISIKQRNQAYTHSIAWQFGQLSGYIGADWQIFDQEEKLTDTSISFALPEEFYAQITDAPSGICTLTCRTYSGDTQIGSDKTCSFMVMTRESECVPDVTGMVADINEKTLALTGDETVMVQGFSTALCTLTASAKNGASITGKQILGTDVAEDMLILENFAESAVLFQATDSRQYTGKFQCPVDLIPYVKLSMVASCQRTDPTSGKCELTVSGQYFSGSFGAQDNSLTVSCQINSGDPIPLQPELTETGYQLTATLTGLDYTKSHKVTIIAEDKLMTAQQTMTVNKGIPVFDWGQNDFAFHVPVKAEEGLQVAGKQLWEHIHPVGSIYMSVNETDPGELFGGKWEQLKDRFLLAAGDEYAPGTTGGEAEHALTGDEMPEHNHALIRPKWYEADGSTASTVYNDFSGSIFGYTGGTTKTYKSFEEDTETEIPAPVVKTGGGQAHNNMPPYLAVFMWKRVA